MTITTEQVRHVANLARLSIDPADLDQMASQLDAILAYMEKLNAVDTDNVPVTAHATVLTNAFREDKVGEHLAPERALENAPNQAAGSFVVPKVI
jgi:aspartyl-tRNA(Asn)/glutamyl-tRNA(Gln) amidotransferase subunit C